MANSTIGFTASELAQFQCPQQPSDGTCCPHQATATGCNFGHRSPKDTQKLRPIPSNFCVDYLRGQCLRVVSSFQMVGKELSWCCAGFHPRNLADAERIIVEVAEKKIRVNDHSCCTENASGPAAPIKQNQSKADSRQINKPSEKSDSNPKRTKKASTSTQKPPIPRKDPRCDPYSACQLCNKLVGYEVHQPFGLLENCSCPFCYNCLINYQNKRHSDKCPSCKVASSRILIWPFWIEAQEIKAELLDAQGACILPESKISFDHLLNPIGDKWIILALLIVAIVLIGFNIAKA